MKLLIVDDNEGARRYIRSLLSCFNSDIRECKDGIEAVEYYKQFRPDFVLMDLQMRHMNGVTATTRIKALDPGAKVVIVTNHDDLELREQAQAAGAVGYVLKEQMTELPQLLQHMSSQELL